MSDEAEMSEVEALSAEDEKSARRRFFRREEAKPRREEVDSVKSVAPPPKSPPPPPKSPKDRLIAALTGGRGLSADQERIVDAIQAGFGLAEEDPMWLFVLPPLLRSGDGVAEVRELVASLKSAPAPSLGGLAELIESQRDTTDAINALHLKFEKSTERAVSAALAKSDFAAPDVDALTKSLSAQVSARVSESIKSRLLPARLGVTLGIGALVAALAFLAGVMINKTGYDKYVSELEGRVIAYEKALAGVKK